MSIHLNLPEICTPKKLPWLAHRESRPTILRVSIWILLKLMQPSSNTIAGYELWPVVYFVLIADLYSTLLLEAVEDNLCPCRGVETVAGGPIYEGDLKRDINTYAY